MREYASGHLGGAGSTTCDPTMMGNMPRSNAPFLTWPDIAHVPPLQTGKGDNSNWLEAPCDAIVYIVYSSVKVKFERYFSQLTCFSGFVLKTV